MEHLSVELLSALVDGELDPSAERNARSHLEACPRCSVELAAFGRLDATLAQPPALPCASARELRSALLDGELTADEARVAEAHLATCGPCGAEQASWVSLQATIRALPAAVPTAATDAAIARLTDRAPSRLTERVAARRPAFAGPDLLRGLALRGAGAVVLMIALLVGLLATPAGPEQAQQPAAPEQVLVAGVQQVVLYSKTNTLYLLQTADAAVDAIDASTYALRARIVVGGKPTALALHEAASRILVLDSAEKSIIEIDPDRNVVVSSQRLTGLTGTPTSLKVDEANGKIVVAAVVAPPSDFAPAPTVRPAGTSQQQPSGQFAIFDSKTRQLEIIHSIEVAPRLVVADPTGKQTLLVATDATTVVDASYKTLRTLPGGVSAAFGVRGGRIAVLSADAGAALLLFIGDGAPGPLRLVGAPIAVTPLPEGGFAVLLGSGSGNGRIVVIDEAGHAVGASEVAPVGRDLAYDVLARKFTVAGGGMVASAPLPSGIVFAEPSAPPLQGGAPVTSSPAATPSPMPSSSPAPGTSGSPRPSPSPAPSSAPVAVVSPPAPNVPPGARLVATDLYRIDLGGRAPVLSAASATRVWFVDDRNWLNSLDMASGAVYTLAQLPRDAEITSLAVGASQVYAVDAKTAELFTFSLTDERLRSRSLPFLSGTTALTVAPDGRLWIGVAGSSQLLSLDPRSQRVEAVYVGLPGVTSVVIDSAARVWFSDGEKRIGSYDLRTGRVTHVRVSIRGSASALLPDGFGRIWVGTTVGEVLSVSDGASHLTLMAGRPIARLSLDPAGHVWYLAPAPPGTTGYVYGPVDQGQEARLIPGPAASLDFSLSWRSWIADPSGGFYLGVEARR